MAWRHINGVHTWPYGDGNLQETICCQDSKPCSAVMDNDHISELSVLCWASPIWQTCFIFSSFVTRIRKMWRAFLAYQHICHRIPPPPQGWQWLPDLFFILSLLQCFGHPFSLIFGDIQDHVGLGMHLNSCCIEVGGLWGWQRDIYSLGKNLR